VADSAARPSRLPRMLAMAAMILLCAALGMIVYSTLGPTSKPVTYTQVSPPQPQQQLAYSYANPTTDEAREKAVESVPAGAAANSPAVARQNDQLSQRAMQINPQAPMVIQVPSSNEIPATVLVVHSDNASAALDQIGQYLRGQPGWKWQFEPPPPDHDKAGQNVLFANNNDANSAANIAGHFELAPATTMPSVESASTLPTEITQAPPVPPSVLVDKPEYWVHQMSAEELAALRESLRDQFNAPVDEYSASVSAPALGLPSNIGSRLALDGAAATQQTLADNVVAEERESAAPTGGLGGGGGFGGGGGGFGGGGGRATDSAISGAVAKDVPAAAMPSTQPAVAEVEKFAPVAPENLLDAIIVVEPMTPAAAAVESPATMPATLPSDTAVPATQPGN